MSDEHRKQLIDELFPKEGQKWTLATDAKLLKTLESTSNEILGKLASLGSKLDEAAGVSQECSARFANVNTTFLSLANTQFVENRVYEEDIMTVLADANVAVKPVEKTKEEREADFVRSVSAAVRMGTSLLQTHFLKVEVRPEDFDEGDDPAFMPAPFYAAKDPYADRLLPPVIGTKGFFDSERLGLAKDNKYEESLSQSSIEAKSSVIQAPSGDTKISPPPPPPPPMTAAGPLPIPAPARTPDLSKNSTHVGSSESSGLFGGAETDESDNDLFTPVRNVANSVATASTIVPVPVSANEQITPVAEINEDIIPTAVSSSSLPKLSFKDELEAKLGLAGAKPKPTGGVKPPVIPQTGEVVVNSNVPTEKQPVKPPLPQPVNKPTPGVSDRIFAATTTLPSATTSAGLFDDSEEEDDLFGPSKPKNPLNKSVPPLLQKNPADKPPAASNIFEQSGEEDILPRLSEAEVQPFARNKAPFGGVSMFGPAQPSLLSLPVASASKSVGEKAAKPALKQQQPSKSLFDGSDDSDDDLFANLRNRSAGLGSALTRGAQVDSVTLPDNKQVSTTVTTKTPSVTPTISKEPTIVPAKQQLSLFDEPEIVETDPFATQTPTDHQFSHQQSHSRVAEKQSRPPEPLGKSRLSDEPSTSATIEPPVAETLECPQKTRIRIPVGTRRPPTHSRIHPSSTSTPSSDSVNHLSQEQPNSSKNAGYKGAVPSMTSSEPPDKVIEAVLQDPLDLSFPPETIPSKSSAGNTAKVVVAEPKRADPLTSAHKQKPKEMNGVDASLLNVQSASSGPANSTGRNNFLFDSGSDDDEIFGSAKATVKPTVAPVLQKPTESNVVRPAAPIQKETVKPASKASLFADLSDDDSEDIFASKPIKQVSTVKDPPVVKSVAKVAEVKKPIVVESKKKNLLFDDDDDDLDIFKS